MLQYVQLILHELYEYALYARLSARILLWDQAYDTSSHQGFEMSRTRQCDGKHACMIPGTWYDTAANGRRTYATTTIMPHVRILYRVYWWGGWDCRTNNERQICSAESDGHTPEREKEREREISESTHSSKVSRLLGFLLLPYVSYLSYSCSRLIELRIHSTQR